MSVAEKSSAEIFLRKIKGGSIILTQLGGGANIIFPIHREMHNFEEP